jgi:hypothetical protein
MKFLEFLMMFAILNGIVSCAAMMFLLAAPRRLIARDRSMAKLLKLHGIPGWDYMNTFGKRLMVVFYVTCCLTGSALAIGALIEWSERTKQPHAHFHVAGPPDRQSVWAHVSERGDE